MKLTPPLVFIAVFLSSICASAQYTKIDTIKVDWENLHGPPGRTNCYALQADTVHTGTNYGVFRSFNGGDQWYKLTTLEDKATYGIIIKDSLVLLLQFVRWNYFSAGPFRWNWNGKMGEMILRPFYEPFIVWPAFIKIRPL